MFFCALGAVGRMITLRDNQSSLRSIMLWLTTVCHLDRVSTSFLPPMANFTQTHSLRGPTEWLRLRHLSSDM